MMIRKKEERVITNADDAKNVKGAWKVLIIDDDPNIHLVTKMALEYIVFEQRGIELISAFNTTEARQMIAFHKDIAIIFLEVALESENAGFELVHFIRKDIQNTAVRIILRVRQSSAMPENSVVENMDINDYKTKTELTTQKLFNLTITALRSYRDIRSALLTTKGIDIVLNASSELSKIKEAQLFLQNSLMHLGSLLYMERNTYDMRIAGFAVTPIGNTMPIVAAVGDYADLVDRELNSVLSDEQNGLIANCMKEGKCSYGGEYLIVPITPFEYSGCAFVMKLHREIDRFEHNIYEIFASNISALYTALLAKRVQ
jgi:CheY-like chemotaxis protein